MRCIEAVACVPCWLMRVQNKDYGHMGWPGAGLGWAGSLDVVRVRCRYAAVWCFIACEVPWRQSLCVCAWRASGDVVRLHDGSLLLLLLQFLAIVGDDARTCSLGRSRSISDPAPLPLDRVRAIPEPGGCVLLGCVTLVGFSRSFVRPHLGGLLSWSRGGNGFESTATRE